MVMAIPELWLCTVLTNYINYVCVGVCVGLVRLKLCIYNDKVLIKYTTAYVYVLIASLYYELSDYICSFVLLQNLWFCTEIIWLFKAVYNHWTSGLNW